MLKTKYSLNNIIFFLSLLLLTKCGFPNQQQKMDEHIKLSNSQKTFINEALTGDTVVWESNLGYKDSAIILPVQYDEYIEHYNKSGDTFIERAYYYYQFIGTKHSSYVADGVGVSALRNNTTGVATIWRTTGNIFSSDALGLFASHKIGSKTYYNVYYYPDSTFINYLGYLGYKKGGEIYTKIK